MNERYPLKEKLSNHGFTSTVSYDHGIRCFLQSPTTQIRCLQVEGDSGRRRTAFAHALANVLQTSQILYYEFGKDKPVAQIIRLQEGEEIPEEPALDDFDRVLTEACAQSEALSTVLILDQLHKTRFLNHIRLYEFVQSAIWRYSDVQFQANALNLKIFLISDEPLYHSLQSYSFRIWVACTESTGQSISAAELGLVEENSGWLLAMQALFNELRLSPTLEEYKRLSFDIEHHVFDIEQLKVSIYGWVETVNREQLESEVIQVLLGEVLQAIVRGRDIHEEIEISAV